MTTTLNASTAGAGGFIATGDNSGSLALQTAGTTAVTIDTSQNVGIGTTSPSAKLHVSGGQSYVTGASGAGAYSRWYNNAQTTNDFQVGQGWASASDNVALLNNNANAAMIFGTNGTERMRIDSSGRVSIGNTSASNRALWVEQSANQVGMTVKCTNASFGQFVIGCDTSRAADAGFDLYLAQSNGVSQFRVAGNGTIYAQNTSVQSISDVRMKENIVNSTEGLSVIDALRPVRFDFKEGFGNNRKNQLGFIAQEMESVFADAVDIWGKSDDPENPYKSVGPSALIPVLVKAIQELKASNDALTARIVDLESK